MIENAGKLEWFGGNEDALNMYRMLIDLTHTWDDLVDKDNDVSSEDVNRAFAIALIYLPSNPFYRSIESAVIPMLLMSLSAYQTSNHFEKNKDEHGIEIAHILRYSAGHIVSYAVNVCVGPEKAKKFMPEIWKDIVFERFDDYKNEVMANEK
jgi:hypothetical protein